MSGNQKMAAEEAAGAWGSPATESPDSFLAQMVDKDRYIVLLDKYRDFHDYVDGVLHTVHIVRYDAAKKVIEERRGSEELLKTLFDMGEELKPVEKRLYWKIDLPREYAYEEDVVYRVPAGYLYIVERCYIHDRNKECEYVVPPASLERPLAEWERQVKDVLPPEVVEKIRELQATYEVELVASPFERKFDLCDTHTTAELCRTRVECLYGDCKVEEAWRPCSEFPTGSYMCGGEAHVVAKAPAVVKYVRDSENFGVEKKIYIVV